ncbi:MAG: alpha-amylase family glycosyl hydrolase, partial [Thermotogota bacterium]|nr:alpha-amylase family glycosyl hydrolase [Thermotogota bacterium]
MNNDEAIYKSLKKLYPNDVDELFDVVIGKIDCFNKKHKQCHRTKLEDINGILITYADTLKGEASPLSVLTDFLLKYCGSAFNAIHILPFFPYSSDDGFSVIDYEKVNPQCGNWEDVEELSAHYHLMFDAVINHISQKSDWFQGFLNSKMDYEDFFIELESESGLSQVTRPRATPLLTSFETKNGKKKVWTTFSSDQIDLNYKNPKLLLKIIDILLFYIEKGASLIRLDAIGYLWKELATSCIHLTQTHEIVRLFRSIVDALNKNALLITETNVPHSENISYFGEGTNEAHMVYNFSLPPLILHAYLQQSSNELNQWVTNLEDPGLEATYFNFLASHDGIGLTPLKGLIKPDEVDSLVQKCLKNHGRISYKQNTDGTEVPYEMNINYFDALSDCSHSEEYNIKKFLGAYAVAISLKGIPGIYIHSLLGSQNWEEGILKNGHNRAINR